ncbi:putative zinc finger protein CONSTANS-LIKE 11 isoform X2 [Cornus florida]|uniref:putative zinc finger protein CONSTANS-LIKE 11 isoform X2 n=1 Tax=Cornus florida TaxID=4283 RepID=UPI00289667AC|nr:putative zinc finger protein CONSTANS-LIKE 11 isoform X2 [Cornus florida]
MYGLTTATTATFNDDSTDFFSHFPPPCASLVAPPPPPPPPPLIIPGNEYDSMSAALNLEVCHSSSSCSSYSSPSSLMSCSTTQSTSLIQRSVSSHSLRKNGVCSQLVSSPTEFVESESSLVRRVFSTGDLHRINMMQHCHRSDSTLSNEISIIEGMNKACRYSPEEKKERIERYRSKRNLRNFNKKIKYACRKTLADSRPRIRGRFARNDEIEKSPQNQWSHIGGEEDDEDDENWINLLDAFTANLVP